MVKMTLIQGNCLKILSSINENVILITDPPYGINLDLKDISKFNVERKFRSTKRCKSDEKIRGDERPFNLKPFLKFKKRLIFGFPYIFDKDAKGWLVWDKQPNNDEKVFFMNPVELCSTTLFNGWDIIRTEWRGFIRDLSGTEERYEHPTQKPLKLMRRIIEKYTKKTDTIFDPFLGSGTTMKACLELRRNCIGIEIEPKYIEICKKRLNWGSSLSPNIEWEFRDESASNRKGE